MHVGVRELKAKLSEYIGQAASGEIVIVTDRGHPVAQLTALERSSRIEQGIEEGWIEPPKHVGLVSFEGYVARRSVLDALREDRG
ncbi:MAG: type II toxin-antitoxin system prevent-host-death family antitoxin [bacterium]|nr:type II toxin-antitoxin system prevent-host-death family antitoxin [bacterium]